MKEIDYLTLAIKLSLKAEKKGDFPVGAIIVKDNKIIAKAYNKKEKSKNAIKHAEIIAIDKACKKLKTWHLEDCVLYTSMEPCLMCVGAINQSRIGKVVYCLDNQSFGSKELLQKKTVIIQHRNEEYEKQVKEFFLDKRGNVSRETLNEKNSMFHVKHQNKKESNVSRETSNKKDSMFHVKH